MKVTQFGNNKHPHGVRCVFNNTIMIHGVSQTGFIHGAMELAEAVLSLQRVGTLLAEKLFGVTRMHLDTPQTMRTPLQTMKQRQAMSFLHENQHIFKRQTYGEIIDPNDERMDLNERKCIGIAKACREAGNFPLSEEDTASDLPAIPVFAEFIDEHVRPYDRPPDDGPRMQSVSKELAGVAPSRRRLTISAKAKAKCLVSTRATVILYQLRDVLHKTTITKSDLWMLIGEVCRRKGVEYEGRRSLGLSAKGK
jgi:hypothetical protein